MPSWPPGLPSPLLEGYGEEEANNLHTSKPAIGAPKVRRRTTSNPRMVAFSLLCTSAELDTFLTFYRDTVSYGSVQFDMDHPRTGLTANWLFDPESQPSWDRVQTVYLVRVNLLEIP